MPDRFTPQERSRIMSLVKGRDTKPEKVVRSLLHAMGYRFRLHRNELPGKPDIVLPKYRKAIFIHGCFWHGHAGCRRAARPESNADFWNKKIDENMARDKKAQAELKNSGWDLLVIWQCEMKDLEKLRRNLNQFIKGEEIAEND
ncbi:very short patch repair endonuclease [Allochromatium tepidum]|uniref:very short patch repair endonuclease n=1 Tax=Allochromatium tepidum TaxID=553982 RepID=UPI001BCEBA56|nr:very short patch repair endonuclease [Allochromatium tepidum]